MTLFDPGPDVVTPQMSADQKRTIRRRWQLDHGIHPTTGKPLANNGETCETCAHCFPRPMSRTYWKCDRVAETAGPATDVRLSWPACVLWESE